ncbi:pre-rRNA processing and 40S ribosomal subunit assembly [Zygosaccharomyces mellis]|uniref:Pre-rRNA processing and 40S ribosomal subunit assembly n=1 Tax=Zygosaccharomyces mellis TaxID=42258 RepID=A0A4C2E6P2_9SACH|nr:pre-rRNA processing and 40S ribosomal subunit assembly [Zygosaccharomyces mellis]
MSDGYAEMLEQQRRAFEAQFGSLESMGFEDKTKSIANESSDEEDASEESFKGFSDKEDESNKEEEEEEEEEDDDDEENQNEAKHSVPPIPRAAPRVIRFQDPSGTYEPPSKKEQKQLRSGKSLRDMPLDDMHSKHDSDSDSDIEHQNLKNDAELQKFLHESHLLSALDPSAEPNSQIHGKSRARALELHLNDLSTVNGNSPKLEKVPMQVRKGMIRKHLHKIKRHEEEARDAGIVLSRPKKGQFRKIDSTYKNDIERRIGTSIKSKEQQRRAHRQRGLRVQSIGKSTRHGLKISSKDIDRVNKS